MGMPMNGNNPIKTAISTVYKLYQKQKKKKRFDMKYFQFNKKMFTYV